MAIWRSAHITVYDVTTWSWVNLVNPLGTRSNVQVITSFPKSSQESVEKKIPPAMDYLTTEHRSQAQRLLDEIRGALRVKETQLKEESDNEGRIA